MAILFVSGTEFCSMPVEFFIKFVVNHEETAGVETDYAFSSSPQVHRIPDGFPPVVLKITGGWSKKA